MHFWSRMGDRVAEEREYAMRRQPYPLQTVRFRSGKHDKSSGGGGGGVYARGLRKVQAVQSEHLVFAALG